VDLFVNGLAHPLFSIYLAFEAAKRMGPTISATISATAPLFATAGAVLVLGEHITIVFLMGIIGTVAGIMVLSWRQQGRRDWALWALILPIGAAVIRAVNHNLGKFGLEMLPSPYFASFVSFTVSFIGSVLIYRLRIGSLPFILPLRALMWSGLAGVLIAMGALSMYSALNYGRVVVVSRSSQLFRFYSCHQSPISSGAVQVAHIGRSGAGNGRHYLDLYSIKLNQQSARQNTALS